MVNLPESSGRSHFVPVPPTRTGIKPGNEKRETQPGYVVPDRSGSRSGTLSTDSQSQRPVSVPRRCYLCNSPAHLAPACPQISSGGGFTPKPNPRPQVNFCRTKQKADPVSHQPKQLNDGARSTGDCSANQILWRYLHWQLRYITTSGFEIQTSTILEFYFRFRSRSVRRNLHVNSNLTLKFAFQNANFVQIGAPNVEI